MLNGSFLFSDLSSYVPKHSVDFNTWQERKRDESVYQEDTASQQAEMTEEVMVSEAAAVYQRCLLRPLSWKVPGGFSVKDQTHLTFTHTLKP